ncbi:S8 family peptidase [Lentzea tibetensis]|nr:S8 family serine peptidase [Lentzea tibetensis]
MRRGLALGAAVVTLVGLISSPGTGAAAPEESESAGQAKSVTLISGDRVLVQGNRVTVLPAPQRDGVVFRQTRDKRGHITVTPLDAQAHVETGKLDKRLFDVTALIEQHRDDQSRDTLPLIVGRDQAQQLPSLKADKQNPGKNQLSTLWGQIKSDPSITKVWLDGEKKLDDAESHAQIGAPQVWRNGLTGKGVTVAVIDGGYDATHPDLEGKVLEARDFTGRPEGVKDIYGHGTHVAATIAGKGVFGGTAPDAQLIVGKVCGQETCDDSAILEAMEWAAPRAQVVNLSLGGEATDGTDPLSLAVNRLSEQHGTLFVIAAGNQGSVLSVGSPATADAALAVGSVNKRDSLSRFSSRGPRVGDLAIKPEIVAPGEGIGAARASGTTLGTPIDDVHTRASGTSMATPHVAGAAAVLKQQHPDWAAPQLKAALTSSAKHVGRTVYEEGSGRLDLVAATTQTVYAIPNALNFGVLRFPHTDLPPITKTLTYHNVTDQPVTVPIKADDEAISFSANEITIPAKQSQRVDVTLTPAKAKVGTGSVRVTAGNATTAVGFTAEPEQYELTISVLDRAGRPSSGSLSAIALDSGDDVDVPPLVNGTAKVRVLKGRYAVNALISEEGAHTWASTPELLVDQPRSIVIDARQGKKIGVGLDRPTTRKHIQIDAIHRTASGATAQDGVQSKGTDAFYAVPAKADTAYFNFGVDQVHNSDGHQYYVAVPTLGAIPENLSPRVRDRDLGQEQVRYRAQGQPMIGSRSSVPIYVKNQFVAFGVSLDLPIPARRTEHFTAQPDVSWTFDFFQRPQDQPSVGFDGHIGRERRVFTPGERTTGSWNAVVAGTDISYRPFNGLTRQGDNGYVQHWPFAPGESNASDEFVFGAPYISARTALSTEDGKVLADTSSVFASFKLPEAPQRYVLDVAAKRSPRWTPYAPTATSRWKFTSGRTAAKEYLAVPTLRVTGNFDDYNRAPACGAFPLTITVAPQKGSTGAAAVKKVTAELSVDDGVTWRPVLVAGRGTTWRALALHPNKAEFVSLRVKAVDTAGNEVEQTTIRAYGLTR